MGKSPIAAMEGVVMKLWVSALVLPALLAACGGGGASGPEDEGLSEQERLELSVGIWTGVATFDGSFEQSDSLVALSYDDRFLTVQDSIIGELVYDSRFEIVDEYDDDGTLVLVTDSTAKMYRMGAATDVTVDMQSVSVPQVSILGQYQDTQGISGTVALEREGILNESGTMARIATGWGSPTSERAIQVNADGLFSGRHDGCQLQGTLAETAGAPRDPVTLGLGLYTLEMTLSGCDNSARDGTYDGLAGVVSLPTFGGLRLYLMAVNDSHAFAFPFGPKQ
jgi:hypothetical protein